MGMTLSDDYIDDFGSCVGRELLAYVSYRGRSRCFAYPQFMLKESDLVLLGKNAFPDVGCLPMTIGHSSPEELKSLYGGIVVMTVNDESPQRNRNYPDSEKSQFNSIIDPTYARSHAAVRLTPLSNHALSSRLVQVIEVQEDVDVMRAQGAVLHVNMPELFDCTRLVMVAWDVNGWREYVGPFELSVLGTNEVRLNPSAVFDSYVGVFSVRSFSFIAELMDERGDVAARFVDHDELMSLLKSSESLVDWVSDDDLKNALLRVARLGENSLSKSQVRSLRSQIEVCSEADAGIKLTPGRRARMLDLLSKMETWMSLPQDLGSQIVEGMDSDALAGLLLDNDAFRDVYAKVMDSDLVRNRIEQEKARFKQQTEQAQAEFAQAQRELDVANKELDATKEELARFNNQLEEKRKQLEQDMESSIAQAEERRDGLEEQADRLQQQVAQLGRDKEALEEKIKDLVDGMTSEGLMDKFLECGALRQVVRALVGQAGDVGTSFGAESATSCNPDGRVLGPGSQEPGSLKLDSASESRSDQSGIGAPTLLSFSPDDGSDPAKTLQTLTRYVNEGAGRDMDPNDVANLLICVTQGYITTLAGLPGTGKTSLVNILAEALGLKSRNGDEGRFVEVPVERGWTSYKDFIGYYNPFDKGLEKTNPQVFDAFATMNEECVQGFGVDKVAPFLFLLDEANLSSLEHYWSPFLRACDSFGRGSLSLSLGGDHYFKVPGYARFVATVNFDHTTEELSPRFLDRSWVITLDAQNLDFDSQAPSGAELDLGDVRPLSYRALDQAFGAQGRGLLDAELKSKLSEVLDICARNRHPVSPRSQNMMASYAMTASGLMDCQTAQARFAPVDYAVSQKVLPLLSGTEESLGALLSDLAMVSGLPLTRSRVERMLEMGSDSGYYQYFA